MKSSNADLKNIQKDAYKKEIHNFKMDDVKSEAAVMQDFYALLFGFEAQRVIDSFGESGEQAVKMALDDLQRAVGKDVIAAIDRDSLCDLWRRYGQKDAEKIYCQKVYDIQK